MCTILLFVAIVVGASAQNYKGDITPIKGQQEVNLTLDFSDMWVNGTSEEAWIAEEIKDKTEEETTQWFSEWNEVLRSKAYSEFVEYFNKETKKTGMMVGVYQNAAYTINVKVIEIFTGWYGGVLSQPARLSTDISFIKTGEIIPFATITQHYSRTDFWATGKVYAWFANRISSAFRAIGKDISKSIIDFKPSSEIVISVCNMEVMGYEYIASWERARQICPDGWRLPTSEELKCMCNEKKTKKKYSALELRDSQYWTSEESTEPDKAISRTTNDGKESLKEKVDLLYVRFVR